MIPIKKLKHLTMFYDLEHRQVLIEKDKIYFTIENNELYPIKRGLESAAQRFWRKKVKGVK